MGSVGDELQSSGKKSVEGTPPISTVNDDDRIEVIPPSKENSEAENPKSTNSPTPIPSGRSDDSNLSPHFDTTAFQAAPRKEYFKSRLIDKKKIERPWLRKRGAREHLINALPVFGFVLGLAFSAILVWDGVRKVAVHKYCEVFSDNFTTWNSSVWTKEVEVGGFSNGQFEMTTSTDENVFISDGVLTIKPTLQNDLYMINNYTIDLRGQGCTGSAWTDCVTTTNTTNGTIVNPVRSGRINTKRGAWIKYGRVEVVAKLPAGDWLWPAIWMLPKDNVYGDWPRSGEIDIMESRGNHPGYPQGGNNIMSSTLHFGPNANNDGWWRNNVKRKAVHTTYSKGYNTFGVEWSERYIFTYVNTRLTQVMYTHFDEPFWTFGRFPQADANGTRLINPWADVPGNTAPFDQDFYLVLNVAVGGTNGWFRDGEAKKPWIDANAHAKKDFWDARDQWYPTWLKQGQMDVKSVKMWQQSGHNGCNA